jgi:hypothetical protein
LVDAYPETKPTAAPASSTPSADQTPNEGSESVTSTVVMLATDWADRSMPPM